MTNDLVHLEFACQTRKHSKLTLLPEIGNEAEVPIGKYSQYAGTSTLDKQEEVDRRFSEISQLDVSFFRKSSDRGVDDGEPRFGTIEQGVVIRTEQLLAFGRI